MKKHKGRRTSFDTLKTVSAHQPALDHMILSELLIQRACPPPPPRVRGQADLAEFALAK